MWNETNGCELHFAVRTPRRIGHNHTVCIKYVDFVWLPLIHSLSATDWCFIAIILLPHNRNLQSPRISSMLVSTATALSTDYCRTAHPISIVILTIHCRRAFLLIFFHGSRLHHSFAVTESIGRELACIWREKSMESGQTENAEGRNVHTEKGTITRKRAPLAQMNVKIVFSTTPRHDMMMTVCARAHTYMCQSSSTRVHHEWMKCHISEEIENVFLNSAASSTLFFVCLCRHVSPIGLVWSVGVEWNVTRRPHFCTVLPENTEHNDNVNWMKWNEMP